MGTQQGNVAGPILEQEQCALLMEVVCRVGEQVIRQHLELTDFSIKDTDALMWIAAEDRTYAHGLRDWVARRNSQAKLEVRRMFLEHPDHKPSAAMRRWLEDEKVIDVICVLAEVVQNKDKRAELKAALNRADEAKLLRVAAPSPAA